MPGGYGLAQGEGPLTWDEQALRFSEARNYWVVTASPEGRPHSIPVWGLWREGAFWFTTDRGSRKARNLLSNPRVCVHLESGDEVLSLEGTASLSDEILALDDAYHAKYGVRQSEVPGDVALFRVEVESAIAWREKDFPTSATRFTR